MEKSETTKKPVGIKINKNKRAWKYIYEINSANSVNLNKPAVSDGIKTYSYGLMFRQWERYAAVFTALKMTEETGARVGIMGSTGAEVTFAFYGLNMVGAEVSIVSALCAFSTEKIMRTIREEKLTDFIITDDFGQPNLIFELLKNKEALGLRNVLVLHIPIAGATANAMITAGQEGKWMYLKNWVAPICMDSLLAAYANHSIHYTTDESRDNAVIIHTSGTTGGTGKPIALSDKALNSMADNLYRVPSLNQLKDDFVCGVIVDLSNAYGIVCQVHVPLCIGGVIATIPGGALNPFFYKAIPDQKITVLFSIAAMFEMWMKMPATEKFDFSSLRCVIIGGSAVSAKDKRRYYQFLRNNGCGEIPFINGYGISELGGACCLSTTDLDDEAIGYLIPGVEMRIYNEEKQRYYSYKDRPQTGVLYLHSDCATSGTLDGKEIVQMETIGRKTFICTNDLVHMDESGKITYLGRANRYFLNDNGAKFESGRLEAEFSRQNGIECCCVVPEYVKTKHDNIPLLCVKTLAGDDRAKDIICKALMQIFVIDKTLELRNIPSRVLIAQDLPRNGNGKIDLFRIERGEVEGVKFKLETTKFLEQIIDFKLIPLKEDEADMIGSVVKDIVKDMAGNLPFQNKNMEDLNMKNKNPFAAFQMMNQMGSQWMNMMGQARPQNQADKTFCGFQQNTMPSFQQMNQMNQMAMSYLMQMNTYTQQMVQHTLQQMYAQNTQMTNYISQMIKSAIKNAASAEGEAETSAEKTAEPLADETK